MPASSHDDDKCGYPYLIPHYCTFRVQGCKPLEQLESALHKKGLKDPWIRNEVWRFHKGFGSKWSRAMAVFFRGAPVGLVLGALTAALTIWLDRGSHHHEPKCPPAPPCPPPKEDDCAPDPPKKDRC